MDCPNSTTNLGTSIEERPKSINNRGELGHWEIDTVVCLKTKADRVLFTITERKTRNTIIRIIPAKTASAVTEELNKIKAFFAQSSIKYSKQYPVIMV